MQRKLSNIFGKTKVEYQNNRLVVWNYRQHIKAIAHKRALLCYLPAPAKAELNNEQLVKFSNDGLGAAWARVLNELGYIVDIIDWDNDEFVPSKSYDLIIFHGGKNFKNIMSHVKNHPKVIHYLTGSYWKFNNTQEDARIRNFKKRHGVQIARDRYIYESEDPVNAIAKGVIVLGDPSMRDTYPETLNVLTINNASYPDNHFDGVKKDYAKARNNFLFFAGSGNIHKGLDLLIDSFKDLKEHLYIVTVPDKAVLKVFKKELTLPNIHLVGEVPMRSKSFYEVMDKCAYVILPSCSEGQAGSVVECMNQGLIPIVSKETRLAASECGAILEHCSISEIKQTVNKMSSLAPSKVEKLASKTRLIAISEHSPEKFRSDLKQAIKQLIK